MVGSSIPHQTSTKLRVRNSEPSRQLTLALRQPSVYRLSSTIALELRKLLGHLKTQLYPINSGSEILMITSERMLRKDAKEGNQQGHNPSVCLIEKPRTTWIRGIPKLGVKCKSFLYLTMHEWELLDFVKDTTNLECAQVWNKWTLILCPNCHVEEIIKYRHLTLQGPFIISIWGCLICARNAIKKQNG